MLSWYSIRDNKAHEVGLQDNDQSSRALETPPCTRSAQTGCVRRWSTPTGRGGACCEEKPQHVEVRVEEKQKINDVRKTRIHEYSQPAETRGTVNVAVKASSRPWSMRHGPQKLHPSAQTM